MPNAAAACAAVRGIDRAAVVLAVGEEQHHARPTVGLAQPVGRRRDGGADRGAVLELTGLQVLDGREHHRDSRR